MLTVQALSEDDHKFWMHAMGGKEPVSQPLLCHHLSHTLVSFSHCVLLKCILIGHLTVRITCLHKCINYYTYKKDLEYKALTFHVLF